jgi:signal peptidase I
MKNYILPFGYVLAFFVVLYGIARFTGMLVPYSIPATANEPALKIGSIIWSSNLKTPQRFDFVCFKHTSPITQSPSIYTYRLCGMEGDKIEIQDGVLYINGENADKNLALKHTYKVPTLDVMHLEAAGEISRGETFNTGNDTLRVFLSEKQIKDNHLTSCKRVISLKSEPNELVKKAFNNDWNIDQFGSIIVPKDHFFLLGDNRENAEDSRYIGFISKEKVIGTVLF